jgi:AcrR family transcriptional regulator
VAKQDADKAERILGAAALVLAREGYGGATVAAVAEQAGVSRGLLHYYFDSKEEMVARVLRRNVGRSSGLLRAIAAESETPVAFARALTAELQRVAASEPAMFTVLAEGLSASRRSSLIGDELTHLHHEFTSAFEDAFQEWAERGLLSPDRSFRGLAVVMTALVDGLGLDLVAVAGLAEEAVVWKSFEDALIRLLTDPAGPR